MRGLFGNKEPDKILYCYGVDQPLFKDMARRVKGLRFHEGLPSPDEVKKFARHGKHRMIVLDDLMSEVSGSADAEKLFTRGTHHMGLSVVYLVQNLLYQNRHARTISLNCQYMVLFRNLRDSSQVMCLARQLYPLQPRLLMDAYEDATSEPFGYLVINLHPQFPDDARRLLTGIFPGEKRAYYKPAGSSRVLHPEKKPQQDSRPTAGT